MADRVFVHVGAPLAPSQALRDALAHHRRRLTRLGVLYPPSHVGHDGGHRDAVLDVLGLTAGDRPAPTGAWDRLAAVVRDWRRGTAVISHGLLADASEAQVDRIVSSLGDTEVHVVHVAQDLGRAIPRAWQQWVYAGGTVPFTSYAERVARRDDHRVARVFWRSHDVEGVLSRWATRVPADRLHVVTASEDLTETWGRFATTLGIDPLRFRPPAPVAPAATSLTSSVPSDGSTAATSLAGTEVLRLLNAAGPVTAPHRAAVVRHASTVEGAPPRLPEALQAPLAADAARTLQAVAEHSWDLVGDPADLVAGEDAFSGDLRNSAPAAEEVLHAQTVVLHALSRPRAERRGPAGVRRRALRVLRERVRR